MRDSSGNLLERCEQCHRYVRITNVVVSKDGLRVGPSCLRRMLKLEADSR